MSDPQWQRLWQHFDDLSVKTVEQRAEALEQLAADEPSLATELQALLDAHDSGTSPLDRQPVEQWPDPPCNQMQVGPWRLESLIGRGGMGQVWRGYRDDGQFEQQVAIKFPGISGSSLLAARFEQERQTLARLNHPHIAHLLDGGTTDQGQPYLVMEWINGQPITHYCESLTIEQIIQVFIPVCDAVHHAHGQLVLHRDIKPANVLVTTDGAAKLVDFGIAKSLPEQDQSTAQTRTALAFTAEYAAPEQIRGEPVSTASDVHALGAVLYELLSGAKAFDWQNRSLAEVIAEVALKSPPAPSRRATQSADKGKLDEDLDRVVLKALHRAPERRYSTAAAFADDLQNWLRRRPVTAQPDSTGYRLRKLISRHPRGFAAGAAALMALIALTIGLGWQGQRLTEALAEAQQQSQRAQVVSDFLTDMFSQASPEIHGGEPPSLRQLLAQGVAQIENASLGPAASAKLKQTMGRALVDLGELDQASSTLEQALDQTPATATQDRADILSSLALLSSLQDDVDSALDYQQQALALLPPTGNELEHRIATARLAGYWQQAGDREQAKQLLEDSLSDWADRADPPARAALANARVRLGAVHWGNGRFDLAQQQYQLAHRTVLDVFGERHPRTANSYYALGTVELAQGRYEPAQRHLREALELRLDLLGPDHPLTARTQSALGSVHYQAGRSREARPLLQAALQTERTQFGEQSVRLGRPLNNLALVEHDLGQFERAEQLYRQALTLYERELGAESERLISPLGNLALLALDRQQPSDALPFLADAERIAVNSYRSDHPSVAFVAHLRGRALLAQGQYEQAQVSLEQALAVRRGIDGGRHPHVADTLIWIARASEHQSSTDAVALADEAWQISDDARGDADWRTLDYQFTFGQLLSASGQARRGAALRDEAIAKLRAIRGADDWRLARLLEQTQQP